MIKRLKSILILALGLIFSASCLSMCILAKKAFANNPSFYIEGAAFRIPASTEENFGIKFKAHIDSTTYGSAKENNATFGILIVPEDLKGDNAQIKDISGLIPEEENGEYVFSGAVYDILWSNVTRPFTAKAYYKVGDEYTYADAENWFDGRTLFTMASQALVENDEQYESYTENFNTIINYALDRGYVADNFTVNTYGSKILGVGTTFTVTGSIKNSANESKILAAYPVVTVTDSEGSPLNGIIELVDGTQNTYKVIGKAENATIKMQVGTSANAIVKTFEGYSFRDEGAVIGLNGVYAKNATIEKADGKINKITFAATENDLLYNTQVDNVPYVGFESGFGVGKTLAVEFTGKDLPNIGLFLDNAPEGTVIGGLKDAGTGIIFVNANALWSTGRYIGVGPYRFLNSQSTTDRVESLTYYGPSGTDSAEMGYKNLVEGTDYRFELTITTADETSNTATITGTLYIINEDGSLTKNGTFTKTSTLVDVNYNSTAFAFYGLVRPEYGGITFSYEVYDNNYEHEILGVDGAYAKKAQVSKKDGKITSITLEKTPNDFISENAVDNVAYVGFESGFGVGKTLAIEFTGKNLPLLGLFLDDAPEGMAIGGLKNAGTGLIYTNNNANWSTNRYICAGPNRLYNDNDGADTRIYSYMGPSGTENAEMGIGKLDASTDYRFEISIISANEETNSAEIKFTLYTVGEEDALSQVCTFTQTLSASSKNNASTSATAVNYNSTAFAFYGAQRPEFGTFTFSFELYDTPQA